MQTPINKFQDSVTNKTVSYPVLAIPSSGHPKVHTFPALLQLFPKYSREAVHFVARMFHLNKPQEQFCSNAVVKTDH